MRGQAAAGIFMTVLAARALGAQATAPAAAPAVAPAATRSSTANTCDPRTAGNSAAPQISPAFRPSWLVGTWRITVWVHGAGVPDTVIAGDLTLIPRIIDGPDSVFVRNTPLIGHSLLEIEYVPGIEPFRTPVESRSARFPGVELRMTAEGPELVFGNPTVLSGSPVILGEARGAHFFLLRAFTHEFSGAWSHTGTHPDRPRGGFCAVRIPIE